MTTVLLLRHGRTRANSAGVLVGRTPGVELDEVGQRQARDVAKTLARAHVELAAVYTSPLRRCRQTVAALSAHGVSAPAPVVDDRLIECDYGTWTNRDLAQLAEEPTWQTVQWQPSRAVFPGGEALADVAARANAAVHEWERRIREQHGADAVWLVCSHEDVLKTIVASSIGTHLDSFQRIMIRNGAVTAIRFAWERPYVLCLNETGAGAAESLGRDRQSQPR